MLWLPPFITFSSFYPQHSFINSFLSVSIYLQYKSLLLIWEIPVCLGNLKETHTHTFCLISKGFKGMWEVHLYLQEGEKVWTLRKKGGIWVQTCRIAPEAGLSNMTKSLPWQMENEPVGLHRYSYYILIILTLTKPNPWLPNSRYILNTRMYKWTHPENKWGIIKKWVSLFWLTAQESTEQFSACTLTLLRSHLLKYYLGECVCILIPVSTTVLLLKTGIYRNVLLRDECKICGVIYYKCVGMSKWHTHTLTHSHSELTRGFPTCADSRWPQRDNE